MAAALPTVAALVYYALSIEKGRSSSAQELAGPFPSPPDFPRLVIDDSRPYLEQHHAWVEELASRCGQAQTAIDSIDDAKPVLILEGLPHPTWEGELLERELDLHDTTTVNGQSYYNNPRAMEPTDAERLFAVLRDGALRPYVGPKECGGYHADWAVVWDSDGERLVTEFCFGCGEITVWSADIMVLCDSLADDRLRPTLERYRRDRLRKSEN